jgi:hypothetical protein
VKWNHQNQTFFPVHYKKNIDLLSFFIFYEKHRTFYHCRRGGGGGGGGGVCV